MATLTRWSISVLRSDTRRRIGLECLTVIPLPVILLVESCYCALREAEHVAVSTGVWQFPFECPYPTWLKASYIAGSALHFIAPVFLWMAFQSVKRLDGTKRVWWLILVGATLVGIAFYPFAVAGLRWAASLSGW